MSLQPSSNVWSADVYELGAAVVNTETVTSIRNLMVTTGSGGEITIETPNFQGGASGGQIWIDNASTTNGGDVRVRGGDASYNGGDGGSVTIEGGDSSGHYGSQLVVNGGLSIQNSQGALNASLVYNTDNSLNYYPVIQTVPIRAGQDASLWILTSGVPAGAVKIICASADGSGIAYVRDSSAGGHPIGRIDASGTVGLFVYNGSSWRGLTMRGASTST